MAAFRFWKVAAKSRNRARVCRSPCRVSATRLRATKTEDVENALMELAQTQVRLESCKVKLPAYAGSRSFRAAYQGRGNSLTDVLNADSQLLVARNDVEKHPSGCGPRCRSYLRALAAGGNVRSNPSIAAVNRGAEREEQNQLWTGQ